jgi:general secretion pathway protein C
MYGFLKRQWPTRVSPSGPLLVSLLLAALIAIELVRAAGSLVGPRINPAKSLAPIQQSRWQAPKGAGVDSRRIVSAHLFGVPPNPASQNPESAPTTAANLILNGTIATENPIHGIAIIGDGGPATVYAVGDHVAGASLISVYLDHVILGRNGSLEKLELPHVLKRAAHVQAAGEDWRSGLQGTGDGAIVRAQPSFDNEDGAFRGLHVYTGKNPAAFAKAGLRAGDLVTAINGTVLRDEDPQRVQELFNSIQTAGASLTVVRGDRTKDLTVDAGP